MRDFYTLFAVYTPVYVYAFLVLYFAAYLAISSPKGLPANLASFFSASRAWFHNLTFFSIILAMLGTPPTIGFFSKLLTFYLLSQKSGLSLAAGLAFTLILLIFYLQTIRSKAYARKRSNYRAATVDVTYVTFILYGNLALLGFTFFLPIAIDIIAAFFM